MSLAWPLLSALLVAPLFGGRWSRLGHLRIRLAWLFYVAITIQIIAFPFKHLPWHTPDRIGVVLWLVSYGIFILAILGNFHIPGIPLIATGLALNLAAVVANDRHMPALPSALRAAGMHFTQSQSRNSSMLPAPHLAWLVDRWAAPTWVPWANVFSVGDTLIMGGGVLFALGATGAFRRPALEIRRRFARPAST
jgi:hypothetical protein